MYELESIFTTQYGTDGPPSIMTIDYKNSQLTWYKDGISFVHTIDWDAVEGLHVTNRRSLSDILCSKEHWIM